MTKPNAATLEECAVEKRRAIGDLKASVGTRHFSASQGGPKDFDKNWDKGWNKDGH